MTRLYYNRGVDRVLGNDGLTQLLWAIKKRTNKSLFEA